MNPIKIHFKYCAQFKQKISPRLLDPRTHEKCITDTKILFKYSPQFKEKIWTSLHDRRTQLKWIIHIKILFQYFARFKEKIFGFNYFIHEHTRNEWIIRRCYSNIVLNSKKRFLVLITSYTNTQEMNES
jgi:hypothetical protein